MATTERNITPDAIEESASKRDPKNNANTFDAKNYLNVRLDKGQKEKDLKIRLLTIDKNSNSPFKHIFMHTVKVPQEISESTWKSYVCLEKTEGKYSDKLGHKCPFCELRREAYKKFDEARKAQERADELSKKITNKSITEEEKAEYDKAVALAALADHYKEISLANIANEVGILRCIERGHEEDGPKFWKFNIRKDKKDPENIIRKLYQNRREECIEEGIELENILDIDNGRDLKITIEDIPVEGKGFNKTSININTFGSQKPLSPNKELRDKWLDDPKEWSDVFVAKPYEYLEVIINGGIPWFDRETGKWIPKEHFKKNTGVDPKEVDTDIEKVKNAKAQAVAQAASVDDGDNDDLPF